MIPGVNKRQGTDCHLVMDHALTGNTEVQCTFTCLNVNVPTAYIHARTCAHTLTRARTHTHIHTHTHTHAHTHTHTDTCARARARLHTHTRNCPLKRMFLCFVFSFFLHTSRVPVNVVSSRPCMLCHVSLSPSRLVINEV